MSSAPGKSMQSDTGVLRFVFKLAVFVSPVALLVLVYVLLDPFMVVRSYASYTQDLDKPAIRLNRDVVSTEMFLGHSDRYDYDAFVFGSSRTGAFKARDWGAYIQPGNPFHFDAFGESLLGVYSKIKLLDRRHVKMNHVLLIVDELLLKKITNPDTHLYIMHPETSGDSRFRFHLAFFKSYYTSSFFIEHWVSRVTGNYYPFMRRMIRQYNMSIDPVTNDVDRLESVYSAQEHADIEQRLSVSFAQSRDNGAAESPPRIGTVQLRLLKEIAEILEARETDVRVVIAPGYDQMALNRSDVMNLRTLFGPDRVYDYSGVNDITVDRGYFDDPIHANPKAGRRILAEIYASANPGISGE